MDIAGRERAFAVATQRLHAAMALVAQGDTSAIKALYAHAEEATSFFGWGGFEKGWEAVSNRWDWAGQQFRGGTVSYANLTRIVTADLAYTTDTETFRAQIAGVGQPVVWTNRVTHVFRFENGEWRLLHRHANRLEAQVAPADRPPAGDRR
jgi:ketosteroid isomerase-like protein